jgi:hypothetical protein
MANPWDNDPIVGTPLDAALAAEGASAPVAAVAKSIYQQESGSGKNTTTSNAGAVGGMQVTPATFKQVADPGWDINDPVDNARAGVRYVQQMSQKAGGDPALTAVGYYGGPGAIAKAQQGVAVSDPRNPNAPNTLQYGQQVAARIPQDQGNPWDNDPIVQAAPQSTPQAPAAAPQPQAQATPPAAPPQPAAAPPVQPQPPSLLSRIGSGVANALNDPVGTANAVGNAVVNYGKSAVNQAVNDPLGTVDNAVRGLANGATFGYADKIAGNMDSLFNNKTVAQNTADERQQTANGGPAEQIGELASGLLTDGAGAVKLAQMAPTTSKVARAAVGSLGGAVDGTINYYGHNDGPVNDADLQQAQGWGAALGPLAALAPATQAQKAAQFATDRAGPATGLSAWQRLGNNLTGALTPEQQARVGMASQSSIDMADRANNVAQAGGTMNPSIANAVAAKYTQQAGDAVRLMDPSPQRTVLLNALDRSTGLDDGEIAALRTSPEGNAVADAIQQRQNAMALTGAQPASQNPIAKVGRMVVNNGGLGLLTPHSAILGAVTDLAPVRNVITNLLGGRENRTVNIGNLIGDAENARAYQAVNGPSAFAQSQPNLQQIGQQALAQITPAQWQAGQQRQAAQIGPQISPMQLQAAQQQQAQQAALQATQQAQTAAAAKTALQQKQALADQWNSDPSNMIGLSNPNGVPHNADQMSAFSSTLKAQMQARQYAAEQQAQQAAAAKAAAAAANQPSPQALQASTRMPLGGGYQTLLQGGASGLGLTSQEANQGLRILSNHPVLGPAANEMRQTGGVANEQQFYALQNGIRKLKENGQFSPTSQAVQAAPNVASQPSLADAMKLAAYVGGKENRQAVQKAAQRAANDPVNGDPEVAAVVKKMSTTPSAAGRAELYNDLMSSGTPQQQILAKRIAEPLLFPK